MDSLQQLVEAMTAGTAPIEREAECPSCMGTIRIKFFQSIDDPSLVHGEALCIHCHEGAETKDFPIPEAVRRLILKVEGTWSIRLKDGTSKGEGTHAEMEHLAARLRGENVAFSLHRTPI